MGRGNCCVFGKYEGLYFIDNDDIHVYCRAGRDTGEPPELRLLRDLDFSSLMDGTWIYHEMATCAEEEDILSCFMEDFLQMFLSFRRVEPEQWISRSQRVILENTLFYICLEDNQWSLAVELIQKDPPWGRSYEALQARHYRQYLLGMQTCLLNRLPSIGIYTGPWISGVLRKEEQSA